MRRQGGRAAATALGLMLCLTTAVTATATPGEKTATRTGGGPAPAVTDHDVRTGHGDGGGARTGHADDDGVRTGHADHDGVRTGHGDGDDGVRIGHADDDGVRTSYADHVWTTTVGAAWTTAAANRFWTPGRMAAAVPRHPATGSGDAPYGHRESASAATERLEAATAGAGAQAAAPTARHFDGVPSVGVLFSVDKEARAHYCTASVVRSPRRNLILTAGHCNPGTRAAFVPQYRSGAAHQPYGVWAITRSYSYGDRGALALGRGQNASSAQARTADPDLDFAFATVAPDRRGRPIEAVTGGNRLTPTPGYRNKVTVIGYPSVRNDPQDRAVRCTTGTTRLTGYRQLRMECGGFYGGTSGSPWLTHFDERTKTGRLIGNIGGLNGGGPSGPHADRVSYSPYYGSKIFALYARAVASIQGSTK